MANPFEAGSIFAKFGIDNAPLLKALKQAEAAVTRSVTAIQKKLNTLKIPGLGGLFGTQAKAAANKIGGFGTTKQDLRGPPSAGRAQTGALSIKFDLKGFTSQLDLAQASFSEFAAAVRVQAASLGSALDPVITGIKKVSSELSKATQAAARSTGRTIASRVAAVPGAQATPGQSPGRQQPVPAPNLTLVERAFARVSAQASGIGKALTLGFNGSRAAIANFSSALSVAFTPARLGLAAISKSFSLFNNLLTRSIFSIKNLVISIAAIATIRRAIDLEGITNSFNELASGVGSATTFLGKLRKATKGTVSDFELMRSANQAILLGVVQTEEQFSKLVESARLLGRALGRGPVEALQDITLGIGRQSRLILDNLGIVIRVAQVYQNYAASIGKTSEALSDHEKRLAFTAAATEAVAQRAKELAAAQSPIADAFGRLAASLQNTFSAVAQAIVSGRLPEKIAQFLDRSRAKIAAFAEFAAGAFSDITEDILSSVEGLFTGQRSLSQVSRSVLTFFGTLAGLSAKIFGRVFLETLKQALTISPTAVGAAQLGRSLVKGVADLAIDSAGFLTETLAAFGNKIGTISDAEFAAGLSRVEEKKKQLRKGLTDTLREGDEILEAEAKRQAAAGESIAGTIGKIVSESVTDFQQALPGLLAPIAEDAEKLTRNINDRIALLRFKFASGIPQLGDLQLTRGVRFLGDAFNGLVQRVTTLGAKLPAVAAALKQFTGIEINAKSQSAVLQFFETLIKLGRNSVLVINDVAKGLKSLFGFDLPDESIKALNEFTEEIDRVRKEVDEDVRGIGLTREGQRRFLKIQLAFEKLSPEEKEAAKKELDDFKKELEEKGLRLDIEGIVQGLPEGLVFNKERIRSLLSDVTPEFVEAFKGIAPVVQDVTAAFGEGLLNAIEKGESFLKQLASIGADLFRSQFTKVINDLTFLLTAGISKVLEAAGIGGAAAGAIGGALVGIGGLILSKLASKSEISADSFEDQISSAESIRGVVAGPTNVAIAKVSESLKVALQQSEIFLQRIAVATERMAGSPGGAPANGNSGLQSSFVRLSTSTPT